MGMAETSLKENRGSGTDPDKTALYEAEDRVIGWIDRGEPVRRDDVTWLTEKDPLFLSIDEVDQFCAAATHRLGVPPVRVRARKGVKAAHYEPGGVIAVPPVEIGGGWAMRGMVVMHELAHHLTHLAGDGGGHGPAFRVHLYRVLHDLGYPTNARLVEFAFQDTVKPAKDWTVTIGKLLAKAESTSNSAEAEAFASAAQELATRHAIDLAIARDALRASEAPEEPVDETYTIGERRQRWLRIAVVLYLAIADANDVDCFIARDSTRVYPTGFKADIDVTNALFESLRAQMVRSANAWIKTGEYKSETVEYYDKWSYRYKTKPLHASTARKSFYQGFVHRVSQRLIEGKQSAMVGWAEEHPDSDVKSAEVALQSKREQVAAAHEALRVRFKVRGSWNGDTSGSGAKSYAGRRAGAEAGSSAQIGRAAKALPQ